MKFMQRGFLGAHTAGFHLPDEGLTAFFLQSLERVRGGQPPDLWVNAQGVAKAKQHAGFSQIERGAPMGATIKPNPWLPKLAVQAPFGKLLPRSQL